jgi:uncharacterized SAM-binding protein YcdF (DUF218 family)
VTLLATVIVSLVTAVLARAELLTGAARLLTVDNATPGADYLVVLGGSVEDRPFKAAALYRDRYAPKVLLFEYPRDARQDRGGMLSQTDLYRRILELEGVPAAAVETTPGVVRTSLDEAQALKRFVQSHQVARVIVVTSAEHTRRARWAHQRVLESTGVIVQTAAARREDFDETNWWLRDDGVLAYLHEYLKLPFYLVRYGTGADAP